MSGWISVEDRLPTGDDIDENEQVWVVYSNGDIELQELDMVLDTWGEYPEMTHWMPTGLKRPEPPTGEEE